MESKHKVEAVLFAVGKEISVERLASLCSLQEIEIKPIMEQLVKEYAERDSPYHIVERDNGWKLTVKDAFVPLVSNIVTSTELDRPLMETLAVVAWKYPIIQSDLIKLRGSGAYEHMKLLEEQGFIAKEKFGRTFKIKLTQKFFEYFDLPSEEAKQAFLKQIPKEILDEAEEVNKEADEVERLIEQDKKEEAVREEIKEAMNSVHK